MKIDSNDKVRRDVKYKENMDRITKKFSTTKCIRLTNHTVLIALNSLTTTSVII